MVLLGVKEFHGLHAILQNFNVNAFSRLLLNGISIELQLIDWCHISDKDLEN